MQRYLIWSKLHLEKYTKFISESETKFPSLGMRKVNCLDQNH